MVLTGISPTGMGASPIWGCPLFSCVSGEHQFGIRVSDVIVFVLCISPDGVVLRLVSVLYSLMVEKAESFLRGAMVGFQYIWGVSLFVS